MKARERWYQKTAGIILLLVLFFPAGLYLMWKYGKWSKKAKWIVTGIFALLVIIGGNSNNGTSTQSVSPTSTSTPAPTAEATSVPTPTLAPFSERMRTAEVVTVANLFNDPNSYMGANRLLTFKCKISSFVKDSSGNPSGMNCYDLNSYSDYVQISSIGIDVSKMNEGDTLQVWGIDLGMVSGKNAFGATVSTTEVAELGMKDLTTGYNDLDN